MHPGTQKWPARALRAMVVLSRMVKIEHSVFALPFAYVGAFWAAGGWPGTRVFLLLTLAMVLIRSFAMGFNRLADVAIDAANPRTRNRPLVTGEISPLQTRVFLLICALGFWAACWGLNTLCFLLAPFALLWAAGYSFAKRFTPLCHYALGSVHFLAPIAGWIAFDPVLAPVPVVLGLGVLFWVAGFDILYSCQDVGFDREHGLFSIPATWGIPVALTLSTFSHVNTVIFFGLAGWIQGAGWIYAASWLFVSAILLFEHTLIKENDMRRVNMAFFTLNGLVALVFLLGVLTDLFLISVSPLQSAF
ncbi:UbiA-like polyprenyltransferase [Desulfoplanes sp.]